MGVNELVQGYQKYGNLKLVEDSLTRKNAELERLRGEKEKITGELDAFNDTVKVKLEEAWDDGLDRLGRVETEQINIIKGLSRSLEDKLNTVSGQLLGTMKKVDADLVQWGEIMKKSGELEEQLKLAYIIYGMWYNPNAARELSVHEVAQMAFIVDTWAQVNWQGVLEYPSEGVADLSFSLHKTTQYPLIALTQFITEEFERRIKS